MECSNAVHKFAAVVNCLTEEFFDKDISDIDYQRQIDEVICEYLSERLNPTEE